VNNNKGNKSSAGVLMMALGIVGIVAFGFASIGLFTLAGFASPFRVGAFVCFGLFAGSFAVMLAGSRRRGVIARLGRYVAALSGRASVLTLEALAAETATTPQVIRKDMRLMKKWNLSFDLYMDAGETSVMRGKEPYKAYLEAERMRQEAEQAAAERERRMADPQLAPLEAFRAEGMAAIDKIRAANVLLPGEGISDKLSKLETTMQRIFSHIEKHPEKLPETRRLMNYHLPTTLKLVDKYCQYDVMEFQPANVRQAKEEIEATLETAEEAFRNFLAGLFHEDTLDVTTDAEVLKQMLEQEGLTGKPFTFGQTGAAGAAQGGAAGAAQGSEARAVQGSGVR